MTVGGQWVSELSQEETRPGHYKGYMAFDEKYFKAPGTYIFCYDGQGYHTVENYGFIPIMEVPWRGLPNVFISSSRMANAEMQARLTDSTRASPFDKDTPEREHTRWKKWVSKAVLERHTKRGLFGAERQPQWWV